MLYFKMSYQLQIIPVRGPRVAACLLEGVHSTFR